MSILHDIISMVINMKMYTIFSLLCFLFWGTADLFYKKSNSTKDKYSDLKTAIIVGIVMGIYATIFMIVKHINIFNNLVDVFKYLPVSICYILSMYIGYKGLKYIELSISSPVQNTSGVITSLLLLLFFKETLPTLAYYAFILIFIGIIGISILEKKDKKVAKLNRKTTVLAIVFPIVYCLIDGLGTFLDAIYLDKFELISEDIALVAYEYTFLLVAIFGILYLKKKKEKIQVFKEKNMWCASILETIGQFFYVYAMSGNSTINASIVGSYCILSMILSSIFLKEKLSLKKYICLFLAIVGIVILSILDI